MVKPSTSELGMSAGESQSLDRSQSPDRNPDSEDEEIRVPKRKSRVIESDAEETDEEDADELGDERVITENCSDRINGTFWCCTHFVHDDCHCFPNEVTTYKLRKVEYKVLGGGYEVETCPRTKKKHHQCWMFLDKVIRFEQLKKMFCQKIHWAKMAGTVAQNIKYCSKEKKYVGFGIQDKENCHIRAGKGQRNDLASVAQASESGMTIRSIAKQYPIEYIKYYRGIGAHHGLVQAARPDAPRRFIILWGEPGSGKSMHAMDIIGSDTVFRPDSNNSSAQSFENYDGQKWILFEEFNGKTLYMDDLKTMTDRYSCVLRGRGCSKAGLHDGVIITCNSCPTSWYPDANPVHLDALLRRVEKLYQCNRDKWMNQLTGKVIDNPYKEVAEAAPVRSWSSLPSLPSANSTSATSSSSFLLNNKKQQFGKHFPAIEIE
jgi:hypothetical protein